VKVITCLADVTPGMTLATCGNCDILPPFPIPFTYYWGRFKRQLAKRQLYSFIWEHQRHDGYAITWPVHVSAVIDGTFGNTEYPNFFEMTYPVGRIGSMRELVGRDVAICEPLQPIDIDAFCRNLRALEGQPYDVVELIAHFISGKLKRTLANRGIIDKYYRYTCSTSLSIEGYAKAGFQFPDGRLPEDVTPALYVNYPKYFGVTMLPNAQF